MIFLSFGAGVQSSVMLMRALAGDIERPDHVIWADTGFEPRAVYRHVDWAERQCAKHGLPFHRVRSKLTLRDSFHEFERGERKHWKNAAPIRNEDGAPTLRKCTAGVKIYPLRKAEIKLLGHKTSRGIPKGSAVVQIGISTDEARRAAPSEESWVDRSYPLIDPLKMTRNDCRAWWEAHFPHVNLPSSSCTICPFKTVKMWHDMRQNQPDDFAEAVDYDERIRAAYEKYYGRSFYLTGQARPLSDLGPEQGALDLEDAIYCAGGCGL